MPIRTLSAAVVAALLAMAPLAVGQDAKKAPPAKAAEKSAVPAPSPAPAAPAGTVLYPPVYFDLLLKERLAAGQPDSPQMREAIREELNTRELIVREAKKKGLDKDNNLKAQMDLTAQTVMVRAYVQDYIKAHPVSEEILKKEYDAIKSQLGDREYRARHILVEKEDEAKEVIAALQKGEKFEKLAERSKDPGSKANGGDLDWNSPANFVKPFSDAMTRLEKGKFTPQPIQTQFGYHVIRLDDIRDAKVPGFDEVKPQLLQRLQPKVIDDHLRDLRAKASVK